MVVHHPLRHNCVKMVRNSVRVSQNGTISPARPSTAKNDERGRAFEGDVLDGG